MTLHVTAPNIVCCVPTFCMVIGSVAEDGSLPRRPRTMAIFLYDLLVIEAADEVQLAASADAVGAPRLHF